MVRNLCIYVMYNEKGIVEPYVDYILTDLSNNAEELYIVVNGAIAQKEMTKLLKYTGNVVVRNNSGYDAGAYAEIINRLGFDKIREYDEIVLCNDTFYGPFIPFKEIFSKMRKLKCDFWGLNYVKGSILDYLESYFLVFNKELIISGDLNLFFKEYQEREISDVKDVCAYFETGMFQYLKRKGYKYSSFCYTDNYNVYRDPDKCLIDYKLPIVKKKCFTSRYYSKLKINRVLQELREKYSFDEEILPLQTVSDAHVGTCTGKSDKDDSYIETPITIDEEKLLFFIENNEAYIYGTGLYARKLWAVYSSSFKHFKGFIETEKSKDILYDYPIYEYGQIPAGASIVVGMNYRNSESLRKKLRKQDNVLYLYS